MNAQKFTQKSMEALQSAQSIAQEYSAAAMEQEHLLYALLTQENGLIPRLIQGLSHTGNTFTEGALHLVEQLPKVGGTSREADKIYISADVDKTLNAAEKSAESDLEQQSESIYHKCHY